MADSQDNLEDRESGEAAVLEAVALRVIAGERAAETEFVKMTRFALWMILIRRGCTRDEAEDLAQEALLVAIGRLRAGEIEDPSRINGYLLRTALYLRRGAQRRLSETRTVYDADSIDRYADEKADPMAELDRGQRQQLLQQALSWLRQPRDRELLRRHYLLQQDKREVCADLGLSMEHFDRVLHRARQRLAELMRPWLD